MAAAFSSVEGSRQPVCLHGTLHATPLRRPQDTRGGRPSVSFAFQMKHYLIPLYLFVLAWLLNGNLRRFGG